MVTSDKMIQMLKLSNKDFKAAIITKFKGTNENILTTSEKLGKYQRNRKSDKRIKLKIV